MHQKVRGSIPGQGTYRRGRFDPQSGHLQEATDRCFSVGVCLCLSLESINIPCAEDF